MNRKILVAMDGSPHSEFALRYYKENVAQPKDDVTVVFGPERTFLSTSTFVSLDTAKLAARAVEEEEQFKDMMEKLKNILKDVGVNGKVVRYAGASAGEAIVLAANDLKSELIVMGTRGLGTIRRTLLGSASQYVVHHADVPILVCRDK